MQIFKDFKDLQIFEDTLLWGGFFQMWRYKILAAETRYGGHMTSSASEAEIQRSKETMFQSSVFIKESFMGWDAWDAT